MSETNQPKQEEREEAKSAGGVPPRFQLLMPNRGEFYTSSEAGIQVGLCSECRDIGWIGYKCVSPRCKENYKVVVGVFDDMKTAWIDAKLFGPLIEYWRDNNYVLQRPSHGKVYDRNDEFWWSWCEPTTWGEPVKDDVAMKIYHGEYTTIRQVLWALERGWRKRFREINENQAVPRGVVDKTKVNLQRVIRCLYDLDLQEEDEQELQLGSSNRRARQHPNTRSQERKKRARKI